MKWVMLIFWMAGGGTPVSVVHFESETLCTTARDQVMQPQPVTNPIVAERRQLAIGICLRVAQD